MILRELEAELLKEVRESSEPSLIAIYGRRRIGKTHLVRNVFQGRERSGYMEVAGFKDGLTKDQLAVFTRAFQDTFYQGVPIQAVPDWKTAFQLLTVEFKKLKRNKRFTLFLDELPWLATPKSGLLQALDHYWNAEWSRLPNLKVVLCGSAASWMLEHLIHAKGGLHNRITHRIHLQPFTLSETEMFLRYRGIRMIHSQVLELYMAFGGVPYYLKDVEKGKTAAQVINRVCFSKGGQLRDEFDRLFPSLFTNPEVHRVIFREIVKYRYGMSRNELMKLTKISSGGRLNQRLQELEAAGFISSFIPYGHKKKEVFFRVTDEYCYFFAKWIKSAPKGLFAGSASRYWEQKRASSAWRSWAGYSFEGICLKHADRIRVALGIDSIDCEVGTWRYVAPQGTTDRGAQVDLLFDRSDGAITLCEIKYCDAEFTIDKAYAEELERKIEVFRHKRGGRKQIFLIFVTPYGVIKNQYYGKLVHADVTLDVLFDE